MSNIKILMSVIEYIMSTFLLIDRKMTFWH